MPSSKSAFCYVIWLPIGLFWAQLYINCDKPVMEKSSIKSCIYHHVLRFHVTYFHTFSALEFCQKTPGHSWYTYYIEGYKNQVTHRALKSIGNLWFRSCKSDWILTNIIFFWKIFFDPWQSGSVGNFLQHLACPN